MAVTASRNTSTTRRPRSGTPERGHEKTTVGHCVGDFNVGPVSDTARCGHTGEPGQRWIAARSARTPPSPRSRCLPWRSRIQGIGPAAGLGLGADAPPQRSPRAAAGCAQTCAAGCVAAARPREFQGQAWASVPPWARLTLAREAKCPRVAAAWNVTLLSLPNGERAPWGDPSKCYYGVSDKPDAVRRNPSSIRDPGGSLNSSCRSFPGNTPCCRRQTRLGSSARECCCPARAVLVG